MASGETKKTNQPTPSKMSDLGFARVASVAPAHVGRFVRTDRIIVRDRLRPVDPAAVEAKRVSIRESGQISPIVVRPDPERAGWFILVVGAHRLEAAKLDGWVDIKAEVRDLTDAEARLIEIDENLISKGLTPYERAVFIDARLKVWGELNPNRVTGNVENISTLSTPQLKRGRPSNVDKLSTFLDGTPATMGFRHETAADLGLSEKTVRNALAVARGLSPAVHAKISSSAIGKNEGLLRQVAGVVDKDEQLRVVEALLSEKAKTFSDALVIANGREPAPPAPPRPADEAVNAVKAIWKKAPIAHRTAILAWLSTQPMPGDWSVTEGGE